ncbi:MAG TPA: transglycosylase SLT domain-containing protein [Acidobacteriaceae bacterium]|nr:transglycosylase SLT domain-containing protein [Acidobacteriaceae bacterium]
MLGFALVSIVPAVAQQAESTQHHTSHTTSKSEKRGAKATHHSKPSDSSGHHTTHHEASTHSAKENRSHHKGHSSRKETAHSRRRRRHVSARELARAHQLHHAFVASSELRPMAQQLIQQRTPQAYAGVLRYARSHTGEAAAAAYMALGQAYVTDGKFKEAASSFQLANRYGHALDDYADYLGAKANFAQQQFAAAEQLLKEFPERHPDSILINRAALLLANIKLGEGDPQAALHQLAKLDNTGLAKSSEYLFAAAKANQLAGNRKLAQEMYTRLYVGDPTSSESTQVPGEMQQMGITPPFTIAERTRHADALYVAGKYGAAAAEYQALAQDPAVIGTAQVNGLLARAAVATFKQTKHVNPSQLVRLSDTDDEAGATRLYLMMESARDAKDVAQVKTIIGQLEQRFPTSRWLAEALFSAGNMALVANDMPTAIGYYVDLAQRFPHSSMASTSHWHAAWLSYRLGDKKAAARLFDEQIERYPDDTHISAAIYWRGVVYQEYEKNLAAAAACYQKLIRSYRQYYYADLATQRLDALGTVEPATLPQLARLDDPEVPDLTTDIPEDDIHVERARLLANAGLNQYIVAEIGASPDSSTWRAYAEAQLYSSYGENWRAMRVLKQKVQSYFAMPMDAIPRPYWDLLFPQPYWPVLQSDAKAQGLDPFLVASLIRQESEFNPTVISYANAWGLMQLLPRVGSQLARQQHVRPYRTEFLLIPQVNLKLGTVYFRQLMDEFNGQPEYALAAYNAGDDRVKAWLANGPYGSLPEFVESIPFTQTREYVEAIMRNREMYRRLYGGPAPVLPTDATKTIPTTASPHNQAGTQ